MRALHAKTPLDLLAFVPVALGFTPAESVVMLCLGSTAFNARIDLPTTDEDRTGTTAALLAPVQKYHVERVVFVFYAEQPSTLADQAWVDLRDAFVAAGVGIIDALLVSNGRYVSLIDPTVNGDVEVDAHPFVVEMAVEHGHVVRSSREALRELITPRDVLDDSWLPVPVPLDTQEVADVVAEALPVRKFSSAQLGTVLASLPNARLRDTITREIAQRTDTDRHVDLWIDATARAPQAYRGYAASVLALAAYMRGDGALAWIAVDAALDADPHNNLADLLQSALQAAVNPAVIAEAITSTN